MTSLFKKIILVLLPVITLVIVFELLARTIPTSYDTKHKYLMVKKDQVEILVLGSSHSNFGINPQYFGHEAFNISNTSQCLYQDYSLLHKYLPECRNLKMVIVPISYFTLQSDLALSPEAWRCAYYSLYMGVNGAEPTSVFELRNHSALALWDGPLGVIKNLRKVSKLNINEYGYQSPEKYQTKIGDVINDAAGIARVGYHDRIMNDRLLRSNFVLLEEMADLLQKRNIKMVLVTTPVYKTYYQHISNNNYNIMVSTIDTIAKKHSSKYHNYFYDCRFDINDFLDNDHLNEAGAKKFSTIMKKEIIDKMM